MGGRTLLAAMLAAGCCQAIASPEVPDRPEPMRVEGMLPWGTVKRVMEPEYPKSLVEAKGKTFLDISGRINRVGALEDAEYTAESVEARLMVAPMKEVMRHWRFEVPFGDDCQPVAALVQTRVWFDFDGPQPKLSVARLKSPRYEAVAATIKVVDRYEPRYPYQMQRRAWQADVYARLEIAPSGDVVEVKAIAQPKQEGVDLSMFEAEVVERMMRWKFTPAPEIPRNRAACYTVQFRIRD